jgi:hypothetical protein
MKKLEISQIESIQGGDGITLSCAVSVIGWGLAFAGLVTATAGGALLAAVSYSVATASIPLSC